MWVSLTRVNLLRFRFKVYVTDGRFYKSRPKTTAWTQVVLNFHGPNNGEGITVFFNGAAIARDASKFIGRYSTGDGGIVVGRFYTNRDQRYTSVEFDELVSFNNSLTLEEIKYLYTVA